jgi:Fe-S-cluster containining protein
MQLESGGDQLTVDMTIPLASGETVSYQEVFQFTETSPPDYLKFALASLGDAIIRAVRERAVRAGPVPCDTCSAKCCHSYGWVPVTMEDYQRLLAAGHPKGAVTFFDGGSAEEPKPRWDGYIGTMTLQPWRGYSEDEGEDACVMLDPRTSRCTAYEARPETCRVYSSWDCDIHEELPSKRKLKMLGRHR